MCARLNAVLIVFSSNDFSTKKISGVGGVPLLRLLLFLECDLHRGNVSRVSALSRRNLLAANGNAVDLGVFEEPVADNLRYVDCCAYSATARFQSDFVAVAHIEAGDDCHDIVHWRLVSHENHVLF